MKAKNLKEWHKLVCERDNYVCQTCDTDFSYSCYFQEDVNQYVCGHHVKTQGANPELKLSIDNGQCICSECHNGLHSGSLTAKYCSNTCVYLSRKEYVKSWKRDAIIKNINY